MEAAVLKLLQEALGHDFDDPVWLETALTHKSYAHEHQCADNERFEFLGDAILQFLISQILFDSYPDLSEGMLSKFRAALVSEEGLAKIARRIDLGMFLRLGRGEDANGGRDKRSILADAVEAVIAACYLDSRQADGPQAARRLVRRLFDPEVEAVEERFERIDHKTDLQERVQRDRLGEILYQVREEKGPDHDKEFLVEVLVGQEKLGEAWGTSKKRAEQKAAVMALKTLKERE
ncbi:MAG: ribonuclease III [bacterium]|nr:ribonuclease III [bacterium]